MNDFIRKGQTGEAGNKGQFGSKRHSDAEVTLLSPGAPEPTEDQVARVDAEIALRKRLFPRATAEELDTARAEMLERLSIQEAAYEAWRRGESHPDDQDFDDIWEGREPGVSRKQAEQAIADFRGGAGHENLIARYEEALECGGKNLSVNQSAVYRRHTMRTNAAA